MFLYWNRKTEKKNVFYLSSNIFILVYSNFYLIEPEKATNQLTPCQLLDLFSSLIPNSSPPIALSKPIHRTWAFSTKTYLIAFRLDITSFISWLFISIFLFSFVFYQRLIHFCARQRATPLAKQPLLQLRNIYANEYYTCTYTYIYIYKYIYVHRHAIFDFNNFKIQ